MATTNVLLREDVEHLGARGEIVRVKAGYARNYLLPRKLAVEASASNVKQIEQERAALLRKEARERGSAEAQAEQMRSLRLTFERRVGEHGMLYGSVTAMHIAEALKEKGYEMDRRRILLPEPIKETGDFTVTVRLHREVTLDLPITVADERGASTGAAGTGASAEAGAAGGDAAATGAADAAAVGGAEGAGDDTAQA